MTLNDLRKHTVMERKLSQVSTLKLLSVPRISRVLQIDSTTSRKISMDLTSENLSVQVIKEVMIGQRKQKLVLCSLVFPVKVLTALRK